MRRQTPKRRSGLGGPKSHLDKLMEQEQVDIDTLPEVLRTLDVRDLEDAWIALFVDAVVESDVLIRKGDLAALCRCLRIVRSRLMESLEKANAAVEAGGVG